MTSDLTKEFMMPRAHNCEIIVCGGYNPITNEQCTNETVVLQKDKIISYTCPICYNFGRKLKK